MKPYIYLFIRDDLSHCQQIVQTAHAVDELNKKIKTNAGVNHMVLFPAQDRDELFDISDYLDHHNIIYHMFHESDIGECTAIATEPLVGDRRKPMRGFRTKR